MPLLQVRNFPQDLYEDIGRIAESERRSIAQQTVVLLRDAVQQSPSEKERRHQILARLARIAEAVPDGIPTPEAYIREDRER